MPTEDDRTLFVVLNFNGWQETLRCMNSVFKQTRTDFDVMLIDNGSHDDSLEHLAEFENKKQVIFVKQPKNLGFAGGVNVGIRYAIEHGYAYTALLNNDATLANDWLEILIASVGRTGASSATGLLLDSAGKVIESTGDGCSSWGLPYPRQRGQSVSEAYESGFVFGGTAGASVYKTSLFEDIGLFDEAFFAYYEDTDISFRSQLSGHTAYYEKAAVGYHDHGTTSSKMPGFTVYQTFKNLPLFFWKNVPLPLLVQTGVRFAICYGAMYVRAVKRGQFGVATRGLLRSLSLLPHALHDRWRIQRQRTVSADYLKTVIYQGLSPNTTALQSLRRKLGMS
jgi:GT2 family glycosyltransferase